MRSHFLSSVLLVVFLSLNSFAQEPQQRPNQTGLLLEITYLKGVPPAFEFVRAPGSKSPGDWFGRFGHVAGWQLPAGAEPIQAVRISPRVKDDRIRIKVSVLRGEQFLDTEEPVAEYQLLENEKTTVEELKNFGIEPFEIKVVKATELVANLPVPINHTTSVEVLALEPIPSDLPEYKITLHNLSPKPIQAVRVEMVDGQRRLGTGMPQGRDGKPLMLGGETVEVRLPVMVRAARVEGGYSPALPPQEQLVIKSLVFADGTDEGMIEREFETGRGYQSVRFGEKIEMQRALPLIADALESTDAIATNGPARLRSALENLDVSITDGELSDLAQRFPTRGLKLLRPQVEFGVHFMRKQMLEELGHVRPHATDEDFRRWLVETKERYSQWLARLDTPTEPQP